jgi:modulator of FtsH protease HflK
MNPIDIKPLEKNRKIALQGLVCQCIFSVFMIAFSIWNKSLLFSSITCLACAWLPVWIIIFSKMHLLCREAALLKIDVLADWEDQELFCIQEGLIRLDKKGTHFVEFLFPGILFIGGIWILYSSSKEGVSYCEGDILMPLALLAMFAFCALISSFYFNQIIKTSIDRNCFRSGAQGIFSFSMVLCVAVLLLCGEFIKIPKILLCGTVFFASLSILIGFEALVKMFLQFFRPHIKGEETRPAFESYILECLKEPTRLKQIFADVVNHQLGFEATQSTFFRIVGALALPFVFFSIILMLLLSSVVIVLPSENALVIRLGNVTNRVLEPGIHLKAPWPFNVIRKYDVWEIRRVHVGSHQPSKPEQEIYQKDKPILWTNLHGIVDDELLIVAPPADLMAKTQTQNKNEKAPSISLAGADILVEYRIKDLKLYVKSAAKPDEYFKQIAEAESSRSMYQYDIDSLFCEGRIKLPEVLKIKIQQASNKVELGIEVLNVGIGGVHPPQAVASAFQETVSAQQEKETAIQSAEQYAIKNMVETVGTQKEAKKILKAINTSEKKGENQQNLTLEYLLHSSSGYVSETLAEATAYRWQRENIERGKADRFKKELLLYHAAPKAYLTSYYMSVLEKGLKNAKKYMLVGNRDNLVLRFDFTDLSSYNPILTEENY